MSEKEKQIIEKLKKVIPQMSDFDKGYILGKAERLSQNRKSESDNPDSES